MLFRRIWTRSQGTAALDSMGTVTLLPSLPGRRGVLPTRWRVMLERSVTPHQGITSATTPRASAIRARDVAHRRQDRSIRRTSVRRGVRSARSRILRPLRNAAAAGALSFNADGSYENGYTWQYGGVVAPNYGAFAECYAGNGRSARSCSISHKSAATTASAPTSTSGPTQECSKRNVSACIPTWDPGGRVFWPIDIAKLSCSPTVAASTGPSGPATGGTGPAPPLVGSSVPISTSAVCPYTNIAPGIGFPTGWNNVSIAWGPTQAIGIGVKNHRLRFGADSEVDAWGGIKSCSKP